ncbi:MAG: hypothetical protein Q9220_001784 [cf. Caloplaca sp. 1 TL-2023]
MGNWRQMGKPFLHGSNKRRIVAKDFFVSETEIAPEVSLDIRTWGEEGIAVEPRKQLNGKYRVMMDEDVLQAIFLHYVGLSWSVKLKWALRRTVQDKKVWKRSERRMSRDEKHRREYFLGQSLAESTQSLAWTKKEAYGTEYFLAQLPDTVEAGSRGGYDDEDEPDTGTKVKTPLQIRQQLLLRIASELLIHQAQHGAVAVVQSDLQWFYTSLSHTTIFTVLRYFGMPRAWMDFFKKYLETPLKMVYEAGEFEVQCRKRGVPIVHAISNMMAEVVLFVLDMAVNQNAQGSLLYRLTDDIWLWGEPGRVNDAWVTVQRSCNVLGLTINKRKKTEAAAQVEQEHILLHPAMEQLREGLKNLVRSLGVEIHLQKAVIAADSRAATLTLDDQSIVTGDVIIGADGIQSRVRQSIMKEDTSPQSFGVSTFRFVRMGRRGAEGRYVDDKGEARE